MRAGPSPQPAHCFDLQATATLPLLEGPCRKGRQFQTETTRLDCCLRAGLSRQPKPRPNRSQQVRGVDLRVQGGCTAPKHATDTAPAVCNRQRRRRGRAGRSLQATPASPRRQLVTNSTCWAPLQAGTAAPEVPCGPLARTGNHHASSWSSAAGRYAGPPLLPQGGGQQPTGGRGGLPAAAPPPCAAGAPDFKPPAAGPAPRRRYPSSCSRWRPPPPALTRPTWSSSTSTSSRALCERAEQLCGG